MTFGVDDHPYTSCNRCPRDPGDKGVRLVLSSANANCVALARNTSVGNIDIVTASGEISTGFSAQCDVEGTCGITQKCVDTDGRVLIAIYVRRKHIYTRGRVAVAGSIACERLSTGGCVVVAITVSQKSMKTGGRVGVAVVAIERRKPSSRVVGAVVESESRSATGGVIATVGVEFERPSADGSVDRTGRIARKRHSTDGSIATTCCVNSRAEPPIAVLPEPLVFTKRAP